MCCVWHVREGTRDLGRGRQLHKPPCHIVYLLCTVVNWNEHLGLSHINSHIHTIQTKINPVTQIFLYLVVTWQGSLCHRIGYNTLRVKVPIELSLPYRGTVNNMLSMILFLEIFRKFLCYVFCFQFFKMKFESQTTSILLTHPTKPSLL